MGVLCGSWASYVTEVMVLMGIGKFGGGCMGDFREYKSGKMSGMSDERGRKMVIRSWWGCGEDCG